MTAKGSSTTKGNERRYRLEAHEEIEEGPAKGDIKISVLEITEKELIGAELLNLYPDPPLTDILQFRLKDGREVILIIEDESEFYFMMGKDTRRLSK